MSHESEPIDSSPDLSLRNILPPVEVLKQKLDPTKTLEILGRVDRQTAARETEMDKFDEKLARTIEVIRNIDLRLPPS